MLSEIGSGAGHDDAQLVGVVAGELGGFGAAGQLDRAFRTADAAFAVGDQRKQRRLAAHPAGRAQFGERLGPVAAVIGGDADGLANGGDAAGTSARGTGVGQCGLGILVEEFAGGHQMPRDEVGSGAIQSREFATDLGRQLLGFDVSADIGGPSSPRCLAVGFRLARRARSGPDERGAERLGTAPVAAALPVLNHVCLST